jgi:hypothetical protein
MWKNPHTTGGSLGCSFAFFYSYRLYLMSFNKERILIIGFIAITCASLSFHFFSSLQRQPIFFLKRLLILPYPNMLSDGSYSLSNLQISMTDSLNKKHGPFNTKEFRKLLSENWVQEIIVSHMLRYGGLQFNLLKNHGRILCKVVLKESIELQHIQFRLSENEQHEISCD